MWALLYDGNVDQNDKLVFAFETQMIGAENGEYGYDVFLICNSTIIKF